MYLELDIELDEKLGTGLDIDIDTRYTYRNIVIDINYINIVDMATNKCRYDHKDRERYECIYIYIYIDLRIDKHRCENRYEIKYEYIYINIDTDIDTDINTEIDMLEIRC